MKEFTIYEVTTKSGNMFRTENPISEWKAQNWHENPGRMYKINRIRCREYSYSSNFNTKVREMCIIRQTALYLALDQVESIEEVRVVYRTQKELWERHIGEQGKSFTEQHVPQE